MPGFDGSGPAGGGPMTGGARGYCNFGPPMGSIDQGQGVVSALVMAEAEGIGICFGKPDCPVGHEGDQIGWA